MVSKILKFGKQEGSSFALPAHGWVGARATSSLAAHLALRNTVSNSAEKRAVRARAWRKERVGGEFRHARAVVKRFRRLGIKTSKQNNFQILLIKIWRAGVKKLKENCFALRNAPPREKTLCLPRPPVRTQQTKLPCKN